MYLPHRLWWSMVGACLLAGAPGLTQSQDSAVDYEVLLKSQFKLVDGSEFTWEVEHHSFPAALARSKEMYERQAKKPYPGKIDLSKPKVWYERIVTSMLSRDALLSRIETAEDITFTNPSVQEWLRPGNGLCYSTMFRNKEVTIYKAERMPIMNIVAGMVGFLQSWVLDPKFKITPAAADLVLPENARQDGAPQLRIGLPDGKGGVFIWFDPTRRVIRRVTYIVDDRVSTDWVVLTDKYVKDVWPEQVEVSSFLEGELQVKEWWMLKDVKIGTVASVPSGPKLEGLRGMLDMTGPTPRFVPLDRPQMPPARK
jgi:hypothetical protein